MAKNTPPQEVTPPTQEVLRVRDIMRANTAAISPKVSSVILPTVAKTRKIDPIISVKTTNKRGHERPRFRLAASSTF